MIILSENYSLNPCRNTSVRSQLKIENRNQNNLKLPNTYYCYISLIIYNFYEKVNA